MNDPRHPVQPAPGMPAMPAMPTAPRPAPAVGAPPVARPPMAHPVAAPTTHQPPRMPQAQPAGIPRVGAPAVARPVTAPIAPVKPHAAPPAPAAADDDAISLIDDSDGDSAEIIEAPAGPSKIKFGADIGHKKHDWKRQLKQGGLGPSRVRTFHGKLSDQGLEYIDEAINVWLDEHPEVDIKMVTTNVGMFDGKFKDLALIVNVWY